MKVFYIDISKFKRNVPKTFYFNMLIENLKQKNDFMNMLLVDTL